MEIKDLERIKDILTKSKEDKSKMIQLAGNMAKSIKSYKKAKGRTEASVKILGIFHEVSEIFLKRTLELDNRENSGMISKRIKEAIKDIPKIPVTVTEENTIYFPTASACCIYDWELTGQFSDGAWENTKPNDHWKAWCNFNIKIGNPRRTRPIGTRIMKDNYGINTKWLLDIIGDRMRIYGRMGKAAGEDWIKIGSDLVCTIEDFPKEKFQLSKWKAEQIKIYDWMSAEYYWKGLTQKLVDKFYEISYTEKEFKEDLKQIKVAMKNQVQVGQTS